MRDGTRDGAEAGLWISCASRPAWYYAPQLHAILGTVEKAESDTRSHHLNICVPSCLPTGEPRRAKRNRISPRLSTRQAGRYSRLDIGVRIRCRIRASASYQSLSSSICSAYSSPASRGRTTAPPPRCSPCTSLNTESCSRRGHAQSRR